MSIQDNRTSPIIQIIIKSMTDTGNNTKNGQEKNSTSNNFLKIGPHNSNSPQDNIVREWIGAILQSEHLSLLVGNGLSIAVEKSAKKLTGKIASPNNSPAEQKNTEESITWKSNLPEFDKYEEYLKNYKDEKPSPKDEKPSPDDKKPSSDSKNGSSITLEDSLQIALKLIGGLEITSSGAADKWETAVNDVINELATKIIEMEKKAKCPEKISQLRAFLLAFANRPANRDRLNIFTTNYDRLIEYGCDHAGIRIVDRFIGSIEPTFSSTRLNLDLHYNPPGIKEEPRYLHGVVRLTKLHGSLDWKSYPNKIIKEPIAFGDSPYEVRDKDSSLIIYPNPAKDMDSVHYPYSELFRDFAAAICRPNSSLVVYGYGFGDEHINRIIKDMLRIQSTHLLIINYDGTLKNKLGKFLTKYGLNDKNDLSGLSNQISILAGKEYACIDKLVHKYLPNFQLDVLSARVKTQHANNDDKKPNVSNNNGENNGDKIDKPK